MLDVGRLEDEVGHVVGDEVQSVVEQSVVDEVQTVAIDAAQSKDDEVLSLILVSCILILLLCFVGFEEKRGDLMYVNKLNYSNSNNFTLQQAKAVEQGDEVHSTSDVAVSHVDEVIYCLSLVLRL